MKFLLILLLLTSNVVFAKTIARVGGIKGNSFVFSSNGQSATLKYGDKISDLSEIMVEDESHLTLMNYEGHTYHLSGGSHIKFYKNVMEVKNGKVWVRSENSSDQFLVQSVNASASYTNGQFVFSFSNVDGKTQVLVLDGGVGFSNVLQPQVIEKIGAGFFSLVDKDLNAGLPRYATRIGLDSYTKMKMSFSGIGPIDDSKFEKMLQEFKTPNSLQNRNIASQGSMSKNQPGKLYFYDSRRKKLIDQKAKRTPSSQEFSAIKYFEKIQLKKSKKLSENKADVRIFGGLDSVTSPKKKLSNLDFTIKVKGARTPASIETMDVVEELNSSFEKSLKNKIKIDKRHPHEVNQLIKDLKSYKKNFQKNY